MVIFCVVLLEKGDRMRLLLCSCMCVLCVISLGAMQLQHITVDSLLSPSYECVRKQKTQEALRHFMGEVHQGSLWVDACCSGGGYRAMVATAGFVKGLQEIGLWDSLCSMSCLSGSTWMYGPFMAKNESINVFIDQLRTHITQESFFNNLIPTLSRLAKKIEYKYAQIREVQIVDLFGGLLADRLMGELGRTAQTISFCDFNDSLYIDNYPQPIFTVVYPEVIERCCWFNTSEYHHIEVTPELTHVAFSDIFMPTEQLGVYTKRDVVLSELFGDIMQTLTLGSLLGFCGSAYAANVKEIMNTLIESLIEKFESLSRTDGELQRGIFLRELLASLKAGRIAPGRVPNFTHTDDEEICLVDAGVVCNIPLLPLLERKTPLILICDASDGLGTQEGRYPQLYKAEELARRFALPFPSLRPEHAERIHDCAFVFKRNAAGALDPMLPTIIYFFNTIDKGTFEFLYTQEEFDGIVNHMYNAVVQSAESIRQEISEKNS
ncbi:MAG: Protein kinase [candidate division TM6 bacterium GW2011_GWF2_38_10]|nr:MAG: Protein kinase [candidate division TM6 bacterium GW2011_GWF2_38_10]